VTLDHYHRRIFGTRWIAHNKFEVGPDLKSFGTEFTSYPLDGYYRNLVAANAENLRSVEEVRTSWTARIGRVQDTGRIERLYYLEAVHARVENAQLSTSSDAVTANYQWLLRDVDKVLLPTRGITLKAEGGLGYGSGQEFVPGSGVTTDSKGPFTRAYGRLTWYKPLGGSWYGTFRGEAGEVFAKSRIGSDPVQHFVAPDIGEVKIEQNEIRLVGGGGDCKRLLPVGRHLGAIHVLQHAGDDADIGRCVVDDQNELIVGGRHH
jgi:translocation and assembly module TamA